LRVPCAVTVYSSPKDGVLVGSMRMKNVWFPLIIGSSGGDHYFHAYELEGHIVWDVFLWHPELSCPIYEIRASRSAISGGWDSGERSVIFQDGEDFELTLTREIIEVTSKGRQITFTDEGVQGSGVSVLNSTFEDCFGAYRFMADGGVGIGVGGGPPEMGIVQLDVP
jgi:hypothetical protein